MLILIGHGTFDGVEYKFNLVGPDISGAELAALCDRMCRQAPVDREHHQRQRRLGGRAAKSPAAASSPPPRAAPRRTPPSSRATGWKRCAIRRPTWTRTKRSARSRPFSTPPQDRRFLRIAEAPGHRARRLRGHRQERAGARRSTETGEGLLLSSFTLAAHRRRAKGRERSGQARAARPRKKSSSARSILLKYQKAAMSRRDYKKQLTAALVGAGASAGGARQVSRASRMCAARLHRCWSQLVSARLGAATPEECQALSKHGHRAKRRPATNRSPTRAIPTARRGFLGPGELSAGQQRISLRRRAVAQQCHVPRALGPPDARALQQRRCEDLFKEALQCDPKNAQAYLGLALVSADGFDSKAAAVGRAKHWSSTRSS